MKFDKQHQFLGACKIWGAVKFLHPKFINSSATSWDSILVETLPKIEKANNAKDYASALNSMLLSLNDPYSFVEYISTSSIVKSNPQYQIISNMRDSIMYIHVPLSFSTHFTAEQKAENLSSLFLQSSENAKGIILDLRGDSTIQYSAQIMREQLSFNHHVLSKALAYYIRNGIFLPPSQMRIFHRYCPQSVYDFTDIMTERFEKCPKEIMQNEGKYIHKKTQYTSTLPMIILVNYYTFGVDDIISALQEQCDVFVINHGSKLIPKSGKIIDISLSDSIHGCLRVSEYSYYQTEKVFKPNVIINQFSVPRISDTCVQFAYKLLQQKNITPYTPPPSKQYQYYTSSMEDAYKSMLFPSKEYRFLALFRFWNVITYFFSYKNYMNKSWEQTFFDFIPKVENARDSLEYAHVIRELVGRLNDSHAQVKFQVFANKFGIANERYERDYLPLLLQYVEQRTVITGILDERMKQSGISVGDIITHINLQPIQEVMNDYLQEFSYSTLQAGIERVHSHYLLIGKWHDSTQITVRTPSNSVRNVTLAHTIPSLQPIEPYKLPYIRLLTKEIGYADLRRISLAECDSLFTVIKDTKGVIFDLRGYAHGIGWEIASRLTDKRVMTARFSEPIINPSRYSSLQDMEQQSFHSFEQYIEPNRNKPLYRGKVIVLINAKAMSQAEHICLQLQSTAQAIFVGTPTNGTDGTVTSTVLPGGIEVQFTGQEVRHADGRQLQRIGIIPDVEVKPTIAGIRAGRDEVLEKGIEVLRGLLVKKE
ncbi:MAG: S41 family peptidase [Candidatus Kapabacteria bacterium]|nr:S41 family peptidase [Candidatus Kapabacteria bacterium]